MVRFRYRLTKRNIHEASEIEPNTPLRASCAVRGGPWASSAANMGIIVQAATVRWRV
jgi:hypothetical protein